MNEAEKETKSKKMKSEDGKNSNIQPVPEEGEENNVFSASLVKKSVTRFLGRFSAQNQIPSPPLHNFPVVTH